MMKGENVNDTRSDTEDSEDESSKPQAIARKKKKSKKA